VHSEDELAHIKGVVLSVGTDRLRVKTRSGDELTILVKPETIIRIDDHPVPLASIHVGDYVQIEALQSANNTYTAVRIEVDQDEHLSEIEGVITAISGSSITLRTEHGDEVVVTIGANTRIHRDETILQVSDLHVGDKIEVKALRNADRSLTAVEIELDNDRDHEERVEVEGVVTAVTSTSVTVRRENGTTVTIAVTGDTVIKKRDQQATMADIKIGQKLEIKAKRQSDGSLVAVSIKIEEHS
jgi:hypothetical protein